MVYSPLCMLDAWGKLGSWNGYVQRSHSVGSPGCDVHVPWALKEHVRFAWVRDLSVPNVWSWGTILEWESERVCVNGLNYLNGWRGRWTDRSSFIPGMLAPIAGQYLILCDIEVWEDSLPSGFTPLMCGKTGHTQRPWTCLGWVLAVVLPHFYHKLNVQTPPKTDRKNSRMMHTGGCRGYRQQWPSPGLYRSAANIPGIRGSRQLSIDEAVC